MFVCFCVSPKSFFCSSSSTLWYSVYSVLSILSIEYSIILYSEARTSWVYKVQGQCHKWIRRICAHILFLAFLTMPAQACTPLEYQLLGKPTQLQLQHTTSDNWTRTTIRITARGTTYFHSVTSHAQATRKVSGLPGRGNELKSCLPWSSKVDFRWNVAKDFWQNEQMKKLFDIIRNGTWIALKLTMYSASRKRFLVFIGRWENGCKAGLELWCMRPTKIYENLKIARQIS